MDIETSIYAGDELIENKKAKKSKAATAEAQATAEGDLEVTNKALGEDIAQLNQVHHDCMTKAQDFEAEMSAPLPVRGLIVD